MKAKKILLITTNGVNNYGAALQAYALHNKLEEWGDVSTLNYINRHIGSSMDVLRLGSSFHGLLGTAKDLCRLWPRKRAVQKFRTFEQKYLNLTSTMTRTDLLAGKLSIYDLYVSGSDQIWNPNCVSATGLIDGTYFLDFAPKDSRKVSVASSIGGFVPASSDIEEMANFLADYEQISVRESDTRDMFVKYLKRDVHHSLDPTLMLDVEDWSAFPDTDVLNRTTGKYLLMYSVPKLPFVLETVNLLSKRLGLRVVALDQDPFLQIRPDVHIKDAGPEDFLTLFRNASFVVTDSFHGTCFSINFEVPFCSTSASVHSNRILSLLNLTRLGTRLVSTPEQVNSLDLSVDFANTRAALNKARARDKQYLSSLTQSGSLR